jgi:hypothetical protein
MHQRLSNTRHFVTYREEAYRLPKKIDRNTVHQLKEFITSKAVKPNGRLQGKNVQLCIFAEFSIQYKKFNIYNLLHLS